MPGRSPSRQAIVDAARRLAARGHLVATGGNLSVRIPGRAAFAITPSNLDYGGDDRGRRLRARPRARRRRGARRSPRSRARSTPPSTGPGPTCTRWCTPTSPTPARSRWSTGPSRRSSTSRCGSWGARWRSSPTARPAPVPAAAPRGAGGAEPRQRLHPGEPRRGLPRPRPDARREQRRAAREVLARLPPRALHRAEGEQDPARGARGGLPRSSAPTSGRPSAAGAAPAEEVP